MVGAGRGGKDSMLARCSVVTLDFVPNEHGVDDDDDDEDEDDNNMNDVVEENVSTCTSVKVDEGGLTTTTNDNTSNDNCDTVKIVSMHKNVGKGGAVKVGTLQSVGQLCLMVDADGATDISDGLPKVLNSMKDLVGNNIKNCTARRTTILPPAAVFGSRAHLEEESSAKRSKIRTILMHSFHFFVKLLCSPRIKDTQCGFKLFTHSAVVLLFTNLHLRRW